MLSPEKPRDDSVTWAIVIVGIMFLFGLGLYVYTLPQSNVTYVQPTQIGIVPTATTMINPITAIQSPGAGADIQTVLNYLYQRGTDASGVPWSPDLISTFTRARDWQIQPTSPASYLFPAGIVTSNSLLTYFDDVTGTWQIRVNPSTSGQFLQSTYQTIAPQSYTASTVRWA